MEVPVKKLANLDLRASHLQVLNLVGTGASSAPLQLVRHNTDDLVNQRDVVVAFHLFAGEDETSERHGLPVFEAYQIKRKHVEV